MTIDVERVAALIRELAAQELLPRFRRLAPADVRKKPSVEDPSDVVTEADLANERRLSAALLELMPGSVVVGEEAVAADPRVLGALQGERPAWIVDPLDGTKNFVAGRDTFGVIVALCLGGVTRAAWIHSPISDATLMAEAGCGARESQRGDVARLIQPRGEASDPLIGSIYTRFLSPEMRERVEARAVQRACLASGTGNASTEYALLAHGAKDFVLYGRLLPWDHAAGALILEECGGIVRLLDGRPYDPLVTDRGALAVRDASLWDAARELVLD